MQWLFQTLRKMAPVIGVITCLQRNIWVLDYTAFCLSIAVIPLAPRPFMCESVRSRHSTSTERANATTNHFSHRCVGYSKGLWMRSEFSGKKIEQNYMTPEILTAHICGASNCKHVCLKKNLNASSPSEHPPPVREKNVKTFRWDHRLQIKPFQGI